MNLTSKGIYKITVPSGKVYVGMTTKSFAERWKKHKINLKGGQHHCSALQNAFNKYGVTSLNFEILEIVSEDTTEAEILLKEKAWWLLIHSQGIEMLHPCPSGTGTVVMSEERRLKLSAAHKLPPFIKQCEECKDDFEPTNRRKAQRFCSRICSRTWLKSNGMYKGNTSERSKEWKENISKSMTGNLNAKGKNIGGKIATHKRWHESRDIVNPTCQFCQ